MTKKTQRSKLRLVSYCNVTYAQLEIDSYPVKESMKFRLDGPINNNNYLIKQYLDEEGYLTPHHITDIGDALFTYEFYKSLCEAEESRSNENVSYPRTYIKCEYEESDLPLPLSIINDATQMNNYIVDLKTLHEVMDARLIAGYKKNIKLNKFVFDDRILFDSFGQSLSLRDTQIVNKYTMDGDFEYPQVVTMNQFKSYCFSWTASHTYIPDHNNKCAWCGESWSLYNMLDCTVTQIDNKSVPVHNKCNEYLLIDNTTKAFKNVLDSVYAKYTMKAVPNLYGSIEYNGPWFLVHTQDGTIRIGWRKRVIEIEWKDDYKKFNETFDYLGNITHGISNRKRYVHCYSYEDAIRELTNARTSIIREVIK